MAEQLTQEEIDSILKNIEMGENDDIDTISIIRDATESLARPKSITLLAMIKRLEWARKNESFENIREARKAVHEAAFNNWLAKKKISRSDYYLLMNRELVKRGYLPRFRNY